MSKQKSPIAIMASEIPPRAVRSIYPEPFASRVEGRERRQLGDFFGLMNFGVNLTRLAPGAASALRHAHVRQDELVYVLEGHPTLHTDDGPIRLAPGMCSGVRAGSGHATAIVNETAEDVLLLEMGDRTPGDEVVYPDDDLRAVMGESGWRFTHKDGTSY